MRVPVEKKLVKGNLCNFANPDLGDDKFQVPKVPLIP
jgi:hypothetical protein